MLNRILIIGDSQVESALKTQGFGSILNDRFNGEADVILRFVADIFVALL